MTTYFTSESVTQGHPDKVCDQIADAILDAVLAADPYAHVACEVTAITDSVHIFGEITTCAHVDYEAVARETIRAIGYTTPGHGFDADTCRIVVDLHEQSPDINMGVQRENEEESGAGDQGMMFGYACRETESLMPLPIELAHALTRRLADVREMRIIPELLPDGKAQVTVQYEDGIPTRIDTVVVSTQHTDSISEAELRAQVIDEVILKALPANLLDDRTHMLINPTGRFLIGGPAGDSGLTGRKLIVDTYGGYARHGGGAFSGKDPTKVDRSAAYMARYLAKNVVAAGFSDRCEVQLSYAIGVAQPVSLLVDTFGTESIPTQEIRRLILDSVDMRPTAIIRRFELREPIYSKVSCYGHFGEHAREMPWEQMELAAVWLQQTRIQRA
ncbi:methionine adenosyltransferase [Butyricicoccus sp.]|uniref:methionine adenosyltransferase n=1 Tax=Butyricicoccus sp. TaxID=2049021 RepID=UPI003F0B1FD6